METPRYRHLVENYCKGPGLDLGSGGIGVTPWALQVDKIRLPDIHMVWDLNGRLPFPHSIFNFVYSSHCLEDFKEWKHIVLGWFQLVRRFGHLIIIVPDKERFRQAVANGQPDNLDHQHEFAPGELSDLFNRQAPPAKLIRDSFTDVSPNDYSILFIAQKL